MKTQKHETEVGKGVTEEISHELGAFPPLWLILGVTGSAFVFASFALAVFSSWFSYLQDSYETSLLVFIAGVLVTLFVSAIFSDICRKPSGRKVFFIVSVACSFWGAFGIIISLLGGSEYLRLALIFIFSVGLTTQIMLWSICFSTIRHGVINPFLAITLMVAGVVFLVVCLLQDIPSMVAMASLPLASAGIYLIVMIKILCNFEYPTAAQTRSVYSISKRSLYCTMITALPLGVAAFYVIFTGISSTTASLAIGLPLIGSGIVMTVDAIRFKVFSESSFLHCFPALVTLPFLIMPFVSPLWKVVCCSYIVFVIGAHTVMCFISIAEVTGFNKLAVFRAVGISWFCYAFGFALGWVLPWAAEVIITGEVAKIAVMLGLGYMVVVSGIVFRDNSVNAEPIPSEVGAKMKSSSWKEKVKRVSEVYELSPRQQEVLTLLARGRNAGYLQEHFFISRSTAKAHIYNIYKKLGVHSQQDLIDFIENIDEGETPPSNTRR
jgi:DNA-binding CsgD family transcriptional regulator